jgi:tRNA G18 (ribose-2'-O)-methylase SpoU
MPHFEHLRHKPPVELEQPRELVLACPALRSNVNLSRIVRLAGCCGVTRIIAAGNPKVDRQIARDAVEAVTIEQRRSLAPVLKKLRTQGYQLIGLEQTTASENLFTAQLPQKMVLVIGHEREGIADDILALLDRTLEIPVFGKPFSYNVATATTMALYEYCRQYPVG